MDITFFKVPCGLITIEGRDSLYASNEMKILKQRISKSLEPLLEYPPEHISSDRIDLAQMQVMITNEEGCRISGTMMAKKVTGYLYFNEKRMERERLAIKSVDFSHKITHFSFGNPSDLMTIQKQLNKLMSPLDDNVKEIKKGSPSTLFQYYLNVVPIKLVPQFGRTLFANQYTANSHKVDNFHKNNVVIRFFFNKKFFLLNY